MTDKLKKAAEQLSSRMTALASRIQNHPYRRYLNIALIGVAALTLFWWISGKAGWRMDTRIATAAAEQKKAQLPDGSQVTLNAASVLQFDTKTWEQHRRVRLSGEAYFKAKRGRRFTVETPQGTVDCVGTRFNVFARERELEVKCTEGKVQVISPDGSERVLLAVGEQVSLLGGRMQHRQKLSFYPNWFNGESLFRGANLSRVLAEIERQYNVKVVADSLPVRKFSGKFSHKDLNLALRAVCGTSNLKCLVRGDTVLVSRK